MEQNKKILLAFYGDDFTGSTDALEFISKAGAKAILFTEPPIQEQLKQFPDLEAYGIAGKTRALSPTEMEKELMPAFEQMKASGARHVHYKVCSTFDSSPTIGSIGKAIDCGATVFQNKIIPVIGGNPVLGRYCVFGNLFAQMGIGSNGDIYRLDRHPSMSKHPVTPADESDLRLHIGKQTNKNIGLIHVAQLNKKITDWKVDDEIIILDTLTKKHLQKIGEWLDIKADAKQLFSVGSSAIEMALGNYWNSNEVLKAKTQWQQINKAIPLLVVSGSCSPITAQQIAYAKSIGFEEVIIDSAKICDTNIVEQNIYDSANNLLQQQKNIIVHTGTKESNNLSAEKLGTALGEIAKAAAEQSLVKRILVAGGDTSSYAARAMEIYAVEMIAPLVIGAPLCKAYSNNKYINGLQVNFKGGQVGSENYFGLF